MRIKQLCLLTSFLVFTCFNSIAQEKKSHAIGRSAYSDALALKDPGKQNGILNAYGFYDDAAIDKFKSDYGVTLPNFIQTSGKIAAGAPSPQSGGGILALSNPTLAIDALGTFIAKRFKEEINIAFLNKFKADVTDTTKLPGSILGRILPETRGVLESGDPYNYPVFLETLNQAFDEDINNLPKVLPQALPRLFPNLDQKKKEELILQAIILVHLMNVNSSFNVVRAVNEVAGALPSNTPDDIRKSIYGIAFGLNAISKDGTGNQMFLESADFGELADANTRAYYIGLLIRQNELYLNTFINQNDIKNTSKLFALVEKLIPIYKSLANQSATLSSLAKQDKLTPAIIQESTSLLLKSLKDAMTTTKTEFPNADFGKLNKIVAKGDSLNNIARLVIEKKYGIALVHSLSFVENNYKGKLGPDDKAVIARYTNFIANVLSAETKDDLVQALETSANPVGSYRVKRNSTFNVSLNAFAGGFAADDMTFGFTAPVGIYFGWGNVNKKAVNVFKKDNGLSIGGFLSVIDVGAVTSFRLTDDQTELADLSWSNVFSPGAFLSIGLPKLPISINLGGQLGPELKSVDTGGNPIITNKEWFFRGAIVVDIPIFDFCTKQHAYKVSKKSTANDKKKDKKKDKDSKTRNQPADKSK